MKTYFYYLRDPRDNQIKYIGQSKNPKQRYNAHINNAKRGRDKNSRKARWLNCLFEQNLLPVLEVFEEYKGNVEAAHIREWELIKAHLEQGHKLTNGNDGGTPYILPDDRVKPVYQYEISTGIFIKEYRCAFDAYASTGIKDSNIGRACKYEGTKPKFPGGFIWSYTKYDIYPLENIPESNQCNKKAVLATEIISDMEYMFRSAREAGTSLGIDYRQISDVCRNRQKSAKGFMFSFVDQDIVRSSLKEEV